MNVNVIPLIEALTSRGRSLRVQCREIVIIIGTRNIYEQIQVKIYVKDEPKEFWAENWANPEVRLQSFSNYRVLRW